MTRCGPLANFSFAVCIAQAIAQGAEAFNDRCTAAEDLLEYRLGMLRWRQIEELGRQLVQLG